MTPNELANAVLADPSGFRAANILMENLPMVIAALRAPAPEAGTLLNQVAAVRASIDGHVKAQRMGGEDRWALGYNEGLLKLAYIMKRDLSEIEKHGL